MNRHRDRRVRPGAAPRALTGALLLVGLLLATGLFAPFARGSASPGAGRPALSSVAPLASGTCSKPSSVLMPLAGPSGSVASGSTLSFTYEIEGLNYGSGQSSLVAYLPRMFAFFPLSGGGELALSVAPQQLTVGSGSWTAASAATDSKTLASPTSFASSPSAQMSSELIAVMAPTTMFEGPQFSFRWEWSLTTIGGSSTSPWSVNTVDENCPSVLWPAPYVQLVRDTGTTAPAGGSFTGTLHGYVSGQYFFLELETPTGTVVYSHGQNATSDPFVVSIAYDCWCGQLSPGSYLVHIHNVMGALLYSISVQVTSADGLSVQAWARPTSGVAPLPVAFSSNVTPGRPPYSFLWEFGDGGSAATEWANHTYAQAGSYAPSVKVTDSTGVQATAQLSIAVTVPPPPPPPLTFQVATNGTQGVIPLELRASANATGGTPPYAYAWSVDSVPVGESPTLGYSFRSAGNYVVGASVVDGRGMSAERTFSVLAVAPLAVVVVLSSSNVATGTPVDASAGVSGGASPYSYHWTVGNRSLLTNSTSAVTFDPPAAGTYVVNLTVVDAWGDAANSSTPLVATAAGASPPPPQPGPGGAASALLWTSIAAAAAVTLLAAATAAFFTSRRKGAGRYPARRGRTSFKE